MRFSNFILSLTLTFGYFYGYSGSLDEVREFFYEINSENQIDKMLAWDATNFSQDELLVLQAYQGICQSMKAQYFFSPISKLKSFNEGRRRLEQSIAQEQGVENTYLRLLLQLSTPKMLGYNTYIEEDINYLQMHLPKSKFDPAMKSMMMKALISANDGNIDLSKLVQI